MDVLTAAAKALWQVENPYSDPSMWDKLNRRSQMYYAVRVAPIAQAVVHFWENH